MADITTAQRRVLAMLADDSDSYVSRRGCTNSTLNALKRRGFVKLNWQQRYGSFYSEKWEITDAGRATISPHDGRPAE